MCRAAGAPSPDCEAGRGLRVELAPSPVGMCLNGHTLPGWPLGPPLLHVPSGEMLMRGDVSKLADLTDLLQGHRREGAAVFRPEGQRTREEGGLALDAIIRVAVKEQLSASSMLGHGTGGRGSTPSIHKQPGSDADEDSHQHSHADGKMAIVMDRLQMGRRHQGGKNSSHEG